MLKKLVYIILISYPVTVFSQDNDTNTFIRNVSFIKMEEKDFPARSDSIYILHQNENDKYEFRVCNNTNNSIYLFSSYLKPDFYTNFYLNRIDKKEKTIKISFLPILPGNILSDRILVGEIKVLCYQQILYEFIEIKPHCYYKMSLNTQCIKDSIKNRAFIVEDFNVKSFKQGDKIRKIKKSKIKGNYNFVFEFAYYNRPDFIFKKNYVKSESLIKDRTDFKIINTYWEPIGSEILSVQKKK
jgi:hypothetical protein